MLWTLAALAAPADSLDDIEEIVVFADPLDAWDGTRWHIGQESLLPSGLELEIGGTSVKIGAWQIEATLACDVARRRARSGSVHCIVEDVSLRVTTPDRWQRPSDQDLLQGWLGDLEAQLVASPLALRVGRRVDVSRGTELLRSALLAFALDLPAHGFGSGDVWTGRSEPLFGITGGEQAIEEVVHYGNAHRGHWIVQTRGEARRTREVERTLADRFAPDQDDLPKFVILKAELDALAVLDHDRGFLRERVWSLKAPTSGVMRNGFLRLLEDDQEVALPPSAQVSPPGEERRGLPRWASVDPELAAW